MTNFSQLIICSQILCNFVKKFLTKYKIMKIFNLSVILLLISFITAFNSHNDKNKIKEQGTFIISNNNPQNIKDLPYTRYHVKSGIAEYNLTGIQTGTETIYFDKWGMREAKYTKAIVTIFGMTKNLNTMELTDNNWHYSIDFDTKTGTKYKNDSLQIQAQQMETNDLVMIGEENMKKIGGEKTGTEKIAGKTCDIWKIEKIGAKIWLWKGISLKTYVNMLGMEMTNIATKIDINTDIPESKFVIPADIIITETTKKTNSRHNYYIK